MKRGQFYSVTLYICWYLYIKRQMIYYYSLRITGIRKGWKMIFSKTCFWRYIIDLCHFFPPNSTTFRMAAALPHCSLVCVNGVDINEDPRVKCENIWQQKCWQERLGNIRHRRFGFKEVQWYESEHVKILFAHSSVWEDLCL